MLLVLIALLAIYPRAAVLLVPARRVPDVAHLNRDLLRAATEGNLAKVREALRLGAEINEARLPVAGNAPSDTALHLAAFHGHLDVVKHLVSSGADVEASSHDGHTPLMDAAFEGNLDVAQFLLSPAGGGARLDATCIYGESPLHEAAQGGQEELVSLLLEHGHPVDPQETRDAGATPLMLAARGGHVRTMQLLLDAGANKALATQDGKTTENHYVTQDWADKDNTPALQQAMRALLAKYPEGGLITRL